MVWEFINTPIKNIEKKNDSVTLIKKITINNKNFNKLGRNRIVNGPLCLLILTARGPDIGHVRRNWKGHKLVH